MPKEDLEAAEVAGMEAAARQFEPEIETLRGDLRDAMLGQLRAATDFTKLPEQRQRDIATAMDFSATELVKRAVVLLASEGKAEVQAKLEQITVKDGIKIVATGYHTDEAVTQLAHMVGQQVIIRMADAGGYDDERGPAQVDPDQPGLLPEHPDDDSDLADAGDAMPGEDG
jgi:hypothetical protein